ncbi:MAG: SRPBCC domain-containing protein [Candidatus Neomarinimicrobiota bacterium]|nr:MAG: SRPBCC domain-containing protein [Candidatus Neomarinimicrobiota bacterium]
MKRLIYIILGLMLGLSLQPVFAQAVNQPLTGQQFSGDFVINAAPAKVWQVLTDAAQLTSILGYEYLGGARKFSQAGSEAQVKAWGDASSFMLVRSVPYKELRFNLDPENGSYICNCRWVLSPAGKDTRVRFEERYTESGPQTADALQAQVKETNEKFQRLKQRVENGLN